MHSPDATELKNLIVQSDEIRDAIASDKPVVALESTIITHGMPFPRNLETARQVEADIRSEGAVPATIALMDGKIHAGLGDDDLDRLARAENVMKCSRADLTFALATGAYGATTVAATMMAAHLAGIQVFATGGIGGVHKGAEESFDISADLEELARTPVCVVCAGAKALRDLPKTIWRSRLRTARLLFADVSLMTAKAASSCIAVSLRASSSVPLSWPTVSMSSRRSLRTVLSMWT